MELYLISQNVNSDYDTYDSAVVSAENPEKARMVHPCYDTDWDGTEREIFPTWCDHKDVCVEHIGSTESTISESILASFNAG